MKDQLIQKRILIWTASYAPAVGGLQTIVGELATGLKRNGHIVHILSNKIPSALPSHEIIDGIPVSRYRFFHFVRPVNSLRECLQAIYGILTYPVRLVQLALFFSRFKPDVVNVHFPSQQLWFLGILQIFFKKSRWIISLHGDEILRFMETNEKPGEPALRPMHSLSETIRLMLLKHRINRSDGFTTCSAYLMNMTGKLINKDPHRGSVVYNGIDYAHYCIEQPRLIRQEYIFACGRLTHAKGFDMLLTAYATLSEQLRHRYTLVIAGSGLEKESLTELVIRLRIQNRVLFYGTTTKQVTAGLFQHCALAVVPSRREPFGIVLLEAIAAGARIVATNVGGIPEIAPYGNVLLCDPDVDSIAESINSGLANEPVKGKPGITRMKHHFSNALMLENYERLLLS